MTVRQQPPLVTDAELLRPARHLFLSPHYDDIALSCGGTAARVTELGGTPEVALIFGDHPDPALVMTPFATQMHRQWGLDAAQVIASRRAEEAAASAVLGTVATFLPFRDAIYRGDRYGNDDQLFSPPAADECDLPTAIAAAALGDSDPGTTRIYAPLAVGRHVDHQHAFQAGLALRERGCELWFYEDLPYALRPGGRDQRIASAGVALVPAAMVDVTSEWTAKIDAIFAYPSQLSTIFVEYVGIEATRPAVDAAMSDYARAAGGGRLCERFWTVN